MINEAEAIEIARKHVVSREGADVLNRREASAEREDSGWHVSFEPAGPYMFGGGPHVILDDDGSIVRVYFTQ